MKYVRRQQPNVGRWDTGGPTANSLLILLYYSEVLPSYAPSFSLSPTQSHFLFLVLGWCRDESCFGRGTHQLGWHLTMKWDGGSNPNMKMKSLNFLEKVVTLKIFWKIFPCVFLSLVVVLNPSRGLCRTRLVLLDKPGWWSSCREFCRSHTTHSVRINS